MKKFLFIALISLTLIPAGSSLARDQEPFEGVKDATDNIQGTTRNIGRSLDNLGIGPKSWEKRARAKERAERDRQRAAERQARDMQRARERVQDRQRRQSEAQAKIDAHQGDPRLIEARTAGALADARLDVIETQQKAEIAQAKAQLELKKIENQKLELETRRLKLENERLEAEVTKLRLEAQKRELEEKKKKE